MKVRNYKYKIRMNKNFRAACEATLEGCRDLYNAALHQRREAFKYQRKTLSWIDQSRDLTEARQLPEVGKILRTVQIQTLKKLDRAYKTFFRMAKSGKAKGFPRFKGHERYNSFTSAEWRTFQLSGDNLSVQKLGSARLRLSRPLGGKPKTLTIKREHDGWYAIFSCEVEDSPPLTATGSNVGIDMGLESFAVLSTCQVDSRRGLGRLHTEAKRQSGRCWTTAHSLNAALNILGRAFPVRALPERISVCS